MLSQVLRRPILPVSLRLFCTSSAQNSPQSSPLYKLRQRTGIAYSLCKEALIKHNNDIDEAESWLKAQALALGLQKATKLSGRNAREGLVGLALHENNKIATIVELNCETDFVAKNEVFRDLTIDLTHHIATMQNDCDTHNLIEDKSLQKLSITDAHIKSLDSRIVPAITKLGENIRIQRAMHFRVSHPSMQIYGQIHSKTGQKSVDNMELYAGRYGAIVALKNNIQSNTRNLKPYGFRLCQHVIGYNPTYLELPEKMRKHLEDTAKERKMQLEEMERQQGEGYDSDHEGEDEQNITDEWPSMMDQRVIMSDSQTVRDFCKENDFSIVYFNRFECESND